MLFDLTVVVMSQTLSPGQKIVVSGSISNLGPAFDALSVAVGVYLTLEILEVGPSRDSTVSFEFAEGSTAPAGENRIKTAFDRAVAHFGDPTANLRVRVSSDIPMKAGLGSSAAATIAGLRLYEAATTSRPAQEAMQIATAIEGHPDNAAAAMLGGLTLSCQTEAGRIETLAWRWPDDIKFIVSTPAAELETAFARTVLPGQISMRDAVFNLQRSLLLVRALDAGRDDLLREALKDRWHQPARQEFVPGLADALALDNPAVLGVCLSGAGPSVAVIARSGRVAEAEAALRAIYQKLGVPCTIRTLSAHQPDVK